jgi:hypothetical protein
MVVLGRWQPFSLTMRVSVTSISWTYNLVYAWQLWYEKSWHCSRSNVLINSWLGKASQIVVCMEQNQTWSASFLSNGVVPFNLAYPNDWIRLFVYSHSCLSMTCGTDWTRKQKLFTAKYAVITRTRQQSSIPCRNSSTFMTVICRLFVRAGKLLHDYDCYLQSAVSLPDRITVAMV